jgi:hypothetical protein
MSSHTRLFVYCVFLFFLAIWLGSAFHDSISSNFGWYNDPLVYIRHSIDSPVPGAVNTWITSTLLISFATILSFPFFIRYKGSGRTELLTSISGTLVILICTFLYFVPTLQKIFGETSTFNHPAGNCHGSFCGRTSRADKNFTSIAGFINMGLSIL